MALKLIGPPATAGSVFMFEPAPHYPGTFGLKLL